MNWDAIVRNIGPPLYRYFLVCFPKPTAEDLVQETLLRLFRAHKQGKFDLRKGTLRMLAFGIAHNLRLESFRKHKRDYSIEEGLQIESATDSPTSSEREILARENIQTLRSALRNLSEVEQQVVLLHIDEEMSMKEIALIADLPEGTVKSHLHRAKLKLKELLGVKDMETL